MSKLDMIIDIYYRLFNCTFVDVNTNTIHSTENNITFDNTDELIDFMLSEIRLLILYRIDEIMR